MKSSSSQATALLLPLRKTDSIRRRVQESRKLAGATSRKKLHLLHDHHADSRSCKKDGNEEGDSRTAASMHYRRRRREGGGRTERMKKVGTILESQRSVSRGGSRMSNSCTNYKHEKLPPRPRPRGTLDLQSQTRSSYTITESIDESASRMTSPSLSQRRSEQPWMRKNSLIHHARRKYDSSSSSSSSSCWLVSRPASSLWSRPRAVREKPTDRRRGRLRRFKDKLAVIFHHHHHYHLGSSGGDSEVESPTPSEENPHRRGSMRKPSGAGSTAAAIRVPRHRHRRRHGHLYTLLQRLLRHVWHSRVEEEGKTGSRVVEMGRNDWCVQQGAAGGGGRRKLGGRKKKPAVGLGFSKAQRNKIQVS